MSPTGQQRDAAVYRPVSRKYLRYLLEGLNDEDSGAGTFAQLAVHLIHRRKCANVVPATEPSAGGDLGQDARTQRVALDTDGRFRLYASPPDVSERWIFAFSIRQDWQAKLASDAAKIIANGLRPDAIIFVTNQFIHPEHRKIDEERAISERYGVACEILDGQWILDQLYEDDYSIGLLLLLAILSPTLQYTSGSTWRKRVGVYAIPISMRPSQRQLAMGSKTIAAKVVRFPFRE